MPAAAHFQRVLDKYLQVNRRNTADLVKEKARRASYAFYKATRDAAPSKDKIRQDVLALGWKVKRRAGAWPYRKGEKRGSKGPLNRMRAAVIGRRQKAIGYVASGWLPAMAATGANGGGKDAANFRNPKGSVEVFGLGTSTPGIAITNSTPGVVTVERRHGIVSQVLNDLSKDMETYLKRKSEGAMSAVKS
jgi:hypothetical protein